MFSFLRGLIVVLAGLLPPRVGSFLVFVRTAMLSLAVFKRNQVTFEVKVPVPTTADVEIPKESVSPVSPGVSQVA